jgi:hypothetical protein
VQQYPCDDNGEQQAAEVTGGEEEPVHADRDDEHLEEQHHVPGRGSSGASDRSEQEKRRDEGQGHRDRPGLTAAEREADGRRHPRLGHDQPGSQPDKLVRSRAAGN